MSLNDIYLACIALNIGEEKTFELDEAPDKEAQRELTNNIDLNVTPPKAVVLYWNNQTVTAKCFKFRRE